MRWMRTGPVLPDRPGPPGPPRSPETGRARFEGPAGSMLRFLVLFDAGEKVSFATQRIEGGIQNKAAF